MPQHGGSRPFIQDLVSGVTSPDTMDAKIDFYLVSAHGGTNLKRLMIVPDNTFVVFLGQSGFIRDLLRNLKTYLKILSPMGYLPPNLKISRSDPASMEVWKEATVTWRTAFYENYITGKSTSLHLYPKAAVYCPGDILPDTELTFESGPQDVWYKGVYSLPVKPADVRNFTLERPALYFVADFFKTGRISPDFLDNVCRLKPKKKGDFYTLVFLDDAMREKAYGADPKVEDYFDEPAQIERVLDIELFYTVPENLAKRAPLKGAYLSDVIYETGGGAAAKPYRVFLFTGCRGLQVNDAFFEPEKYEGAEPLEIPANLEGASLRRTMRRFSLSSKCGLGKKPALSFFGIRQRLVDLLRDDAAMATLKERGFVKIALVAQSLQNFIQVRSGMRFQASVESFQLAFLLGGAYEKIPADAPAKARALIEEIREMFGEFTTRLRREGPASNEKTIAELLLERLGVGIIASASANSKRRVEALEEEREIIGRVERADSAEFRAAMDGILKKYKGAFAAYKEATKKYAAESEERFHKSVVRARTEANSERDETALREAVEKEILHFGRLGGTIASEFEREQTELFYKFRLLPQAEKDYRMADSMDLMDALDGVRRWLKPLKGLVARLVERAAHRVSGQRERRGSKSGSRNRTQRRSGR